MMQAPDLRHLNYVSTIGRLHWPWDRTVVEKRSVWPCPMIILEVTVGTTKKSILNPARCQPMRVSGWKIAEFSHVAKPS